MKNKWLLIVLVGLGMGVIGFFAGQKFASARRASLMNNFRGQLGQGGNFANSLRGENGQSGVRPVNGEIIDRNDKSITVKLKDNSSKIVFLSDKTEISQASEAAKTDLTVGSRVLVIGQSNTDGSVTADNIQLNSQFFGRPSAP